MVSFFEAIEIVKKEPIPLLGSKSVMLDSATRKVLAEDIVAKNDSPPVRTSAMDGYAFRFEDLGSDIKVVDFVQAGVEKDLVIKSKEACKIFTGAPLPLGVDTIVVVENSIVDRGVLKIAEAPKKSDNIREVGSNFKKGDVLLQKGTKISAVEIALLASLGYASVKVYDTPKVGVVSFGEELVEIGESLDSDSKIYSSNNYAIVARLAEIGVSASNIGIVRDDYEASKRVIKEALERYDFVVTTGGMSKGDFDYIKEILKELRVDTLFEGVKMKPGKPVSIYKKNGKYIFALPGYPNSAFMTFELFCRRLLQKSFGVFEDFVTVNGVLQEDFSKKGDRLEFKPIEVVLEDGVFKAYVNSRRQNSSAIINNMTGSSAMVLLEECRDYKKGEILPLYFYKTVFGI